MEVCKSFGIPVGGGPAGSSAENSWLSWAFRLTMLAQDPQSAALEKEEKEKEEKA